MEYKSRVKIRKKILLLGFTLLLLFNAAFINIPSAKAQQKPTIFVLPSRYIAKHIGETFNVSINIKDVTSDMRLIGLQWKLIFNTTLLEVLEVAEGDFLRYWAERAKAETGEDYGTYFEYFLEDDYILSFTLYYKYPWPPEIFPEGSGTLATITFNATYRPTEAEPKGSCILNLTETMLVNDENVEIEHNHEDGYYEIEALKFPTLKVIPYTYVATHLGEIYSVNVTIQSLDRDWKLIGVQFKLEFNSTILDVIGVAEGDFLRYWAERAKAETGEDYGTYFEYFLEDDYILSFTLYYKYPWPPEIFPEGSGTLATITFNATYKPLPTEPAAACPLKLEDTILVNSLTHEIPHHVSHGYYLMVETPVENLYTIEILADVGEIHFPGELAEFYMFITKLGQPVDASIIEAELYFNGTLLEDLSDKVEHIKTGFYRMVYEIPADAAEGNYAILLRAWYQTLQGSALKTFTVNRWVKGLLEDIREEIATIIIPSIGVIKANLTSINAQLVEIKGSLATIQTSIGVLNASLTAINAKLVGIEGRIATIETNLGTIKADIEDIGLRVTEIQGRTATIETTLGTLYGYVTETLGTDVATIKTDIGTVKVDISGLKETASNTEANTGTLITLAYVAVLFALIAAIASIITAFKTLKK